MASTTPMKWKTYKVQGLWKGRSAGGCMNHSTWRYNQQLFVTSTSPAPKTVRIKLLQDTEHHVGFYVARSDGSGRRQLGITRNNVIGMVTFENSESVGLEIELEPNVAYVVIPCTFEPGQEGSFSMAFSSPDGNLKIAGLSPETEWKFCAGQGEWEGETAGGCRNHKSWVCNPQFMLRVVNPTRLFVLLTQENTEFDAIGYYVVSSEERAHKMHAIPPKQVIAKSEFARNTEACSEHTLQPGNYVIVPCTFDPGHAGSFDVTIFSDDDVHFYELKNAEETILNGEWSGSSAGGCVNFPTWRNNPQFFLIVNQQSKLTITLRQVGMGSTRVESIGFYVVRSSGHRLVVLRQQDLVAKGAFVNAKSVDCEITLDSDINPYVIIPCTFYGGKETKFTLSVTVHGKDDPLSAVKMLPCNYSWNKKTIKGSWTGETAGGCRNHPETWHTNPQFSLIVEEDCNVVGLLTQDDPSRTRSIGFYVLKNSDSTQSRVGPGSNSPSCLKSAFKTDNEVYCEGSLARGHYTVIPCTFVPGQAGDFVMNVYCDVDDVMMHEAGRDIVPAASPGLGDSTDRRLSFSNMTLNDPSITTVSPMLSVKWEDISEMKKIGQGGFGVVYKGKWQGYMVAVKKLFSEDMEESEYEAFKREVELMSVLQHPQIVHFLGANLEPPNVCLLAEYMCRGNLSTVLRNNPELSWDIKLQMALDTALGMLYLHSHSPPIVHRDLKSLNLLVDEKFRVKVADFGLSKVTSGASLNSKVGSLNWCAPEILLRSSPYTTKGDVYSMGMVLWELITHQAPFFKMHPLQIVRAIDQGKLPAVPAGAPDAYGRLVKDCWQSDPIQRPSFKGVVNRLQQMQAANVFAGVPSRIEGSDNLMT
eukprot:TRINITY_DN6101_c0_g1_i1.p1 TRINITY_DN6101_c0_g1~~TRINITY_DN6101_c0_g1_i1.p1  ORF type:complete len:869 (+),score=173.02 TRINITY_DN6101_c0_g1_i1:217-2823(+)